MHFDPRALKRVHRDSHHQTVKQYSNEPDQNAGHPPDAGRRNHVSVADGQAGNRREIQGIAAYTLQPDNRAIPYQSST